MADLPRRKRGFARRYGSLTPLHFAVGNAVGVLREGGGANEKQMKRCEDASHSEALLANRTRRPVLSRSGGTSESAYASSVAEPDRNTRRVHCNGSLRSG